MGGEFTFDFEGRGGDEQMGCGSACIRWIVEGHGNVVRCQERGVWGTGTHIGQEQDSMESMILQATLLWWMNIQSPIRESAKSVEWLHQHARDLRPATRSRVGILARQTSQRSHIYSIARRVRRSHKGREEYVRTYWEHDR